MTCHHRSYAGLPEAARKIPMVPVGDPKRCRCQIRGMAYDHCHHQADEEDMRCPHCRRWCVQEAFEVAPTGTPDCLTTTNLMGEFCPRSVLAKAEDYPTAIGGSR